MLFVTDNRFPGDGAEQLPAHVKGAQSRVRVLRGGRTARIFELYLYERRAQGSLSVDVAELSAVAHAATKAYADVAVGRGGIAERPASRMSAMSSSSSGFGVVRSFSP